MVMLSEVLTPTKAVRGAEFSAFQYPARLFDGLIDPVLNIDWFEMNAPTFPPHPHGGFSAVTYLFEDSPNGLVNRDSLGETCRIEAGALHWSRASGGMVHEEVPIRGGGAVRGLQIFMNLPAQRQDDPAAVFHVSNEDIEMRSSPGVRSRLVVDGTTVGSVAGALPSPVRIQEITLEPLAEIPLVIPARWGGVILLIKGDITADDAVLGVTQAVGFASDAEGEIIVVAGVDGARLAVVCGSQLDQPVVSGGSLKFASPEALEAARVRVSALSLAH